MQKPATIAIVQRTRRALRVLKIICALIAVLAAAMLFVNFPGSFLCLGDCDVSNPADWTYVGDDDVTKDMSLFKSSDGHQRSALGEIAAVLVPYAPLLPASLFMAITFGAQLRSRRTGAIDRLCQLLVTPPAWCRRNTPWLCQVAEIVARLRAAYGCQDHLRRRLCEGATAFVALLALFAGAAVVSIFDRPSVGAWIGVLTTILPAMLLYFLLHPAPATARAERRPFEVAAAASLPIAMVFYVVSVLLVTDYFNLVDVMEPASGISQRPRLYPLLHEPHRTMGPEVAKLLTTVIDRLNALNPFDSDTERIAGAEVRKATDALLGVLERGTPPNIVAVNICRSSWFITWTAIAMFVWIFLDTRRLTSILLVMSAYLAVGLTFGMIYYDYHLKEIAAYNFLLDTFGYSNRAKSFEETLAKLSPREKGDHDLDLDKLAGRLSTGQLAIVIQSKFFAATFSQDLPQLSVDGNAPERDDLVFGCTFQFDRNGKAILPGFPLAYGPKDSSCKTRVKDAPCLQSVLTQLGEPQSRAWAEAREQTNSDAVCRLTEFICAETKKLATVEHRGYAVEVRAGADCTGHERRNETLAEQRRQNAYEMVEKIRNEVEDYRDREPLTPGRRQTLHGARTSTFWPTVQRKFGQDCDASETAFRALWPFTDTTKKVPTELNPWRAAAVSVSARNLDPSNSTHMANALTTETTLTDMVYFSFVSFTTTGYGDIKPVSGPVRLGVILENILEIIFAAFFFAAAMNRAQ